MYSLRQLQQLLYSSRRTKKPMYWLLSAWYWVSFSIILGCCTGWIGALFGIGGIICAVFANKQGKTGLAKAGLICSIIGIVLGIIITILAAVFSVAFMSELTNY